MNIYEHLWHDGAVIYRSVYINADFGFCKVNIYEDGVAELYDLIVYPAYRGKGFGKKLLDEAKRKAQEYNCSYLAIWPDCEPWVEEWYKRLGFYPHPNFRNKVGELGWAKKLQRLRKGR